MSIKVEDSCNPVLSSMLRNLRTRLFQEQNIFSFDVFNDLDLEALVRTQPTTPEKFMLALNKQGKLEQYGEAFMEVIRFYKSATPQEIPPSFLRDTPVKMSELLDPINVVLDKRGMCPLAVAKVTERLMGLGYLEEREMEDGISRTATEKGEWAGIENRFYNNGERVVVLYDDNAQRLVLGILYDMRLLP